jgi:hypothetical protein
MKRGLFAITLLLACRIVNADQFDQIVMTGATTSATVHEFNPNNFSMGSSGPTFVGGFAFSDSTQSTGSTVVQTGGTPLSTASADVTSTLTQIFFATDVTANATHSDTMATAESIVTATFHVPLTETSPFQLLEYGQYLFDKHLVEVHFATSLFDLTTQQYVFKQDQHVTSGPNHAAHIYFKSGMLVDGHDYLLTKDESITTNAGGIADEFSFVTFGTTPEPSTICLGALGIGLVALNAFRKRRAVTRPQS